jgi:hypothetical protein
MGEEQLRRAGGAEVDVVPDLHASPLELDPGHGPQVEVLAAACGLSVLGEFAVHILPDLIATGTDARSDCRLNRP